MDFMHRDEQKLDDQSAMAMVRNSDRKDYGGWDHFNTMLKLVLDKKERE